MCNESQRWGHSPRGKQHAPWSMVCPSWRMRCRPESEEPSAKQIHVRTSDVRLHVTALYISCCNIHLIQIVKCSLMFTLSGLMRESILPSSISAISCRIPSSASQNRSISALSSDSVGSIIRVPATGHDMVGAWKPGHEHNRKPRNQTQPRKKEVWWFLISRKGGNSCTMYCVFCVTIKDDGIFFSLP